MPSFATTLAKAVYRGLGTYPLQEIDDFARRLDKEYEQRHRNDPVAFVPGHDDDEDVEPVDHLLYSPSFEKLLIARIAQLPYSTENSW